VKKKSVVIIISILAVSLCLLLAAWKVNGFADFYVKYIYPAFLETYGRITGLISFSIGEILLYVAALYVALTVLLLLLRVIMFFAKNELFKALNRINLKVFAWILTIVIFIQVANCFVMYHTTPLYDGENSVVSGYEATTKDLFELREQMVKRANSLSVSFARDEKGDIVYDGDIKIAAVNAMKNLGSLSETALESGREGELFKPLSRLTGYYSKPKAFYKSDFFSQQYIKGYFFPFSLEANYNNLMNVSNYPDTFCHELSHLKGFILEDEASFIAYLACVNSGDEFLEYSGLLNAIEYINIECEAELTANPDIASVLTITPRNDYVKHDMTFVSEENWQTIEEDAVLSTEVTRDASNKFLDTNLTVNGVEDGVQSYSRVVDLLLKYYFGDTVRYDR